MRFWDATAVVPLLVNESQSSAMKALLSEDEGIAVWWMTRSECFAALVRRRREGALSLLRQAEAIARLHYLEQAWTEVMPVIYGMRAQVENLLENHPLRTADAYQLAAALEWRIGKPGGASFVCLKDPLRAAAKKEGFDVLPT